MHFCWLAVPLSLYGWFIILPSMGRPWTWLCCFSFSTGFGNYCGWCNSRESLHRVFNRNKDISIVRAAQGCCRWSFSSSCGTGTLTTLMPFVPLLFWPGGIGKVPCQILPDNSDYNLLALLPSVAFSNADPVICCLVYGTWWPYLGKSNFRGYFSSIGEDPIAVSIF